MAHHYLHLSDFTSGPGEDPVQGPGDDEEGPHGPGDDLRQGHPVAAGLHDVAIAAEAVAEAALSVAKALPVALDFVDGAGVEPPTDDVGDTDAVAANRVVTVDDDEVSRALLYWYRKATLEVKFFVKKSVIQKIGIEKE